MNLPSANIQCPYCGERIEVVVDTSVVRQEYIEDCSVCCQPIVIDVTTAFDAVESISVRTEND